MRRFVRRCLKLTRLSLVILPFVLFGMWYGGGRETLTKPLRAVEIERADEIFGDSGVETIWVQGPVLGYFIGLDAVLIGSALSFTLLTVDASVRLSRRRKARHE